MKHAGLFGRWLLLACVMAGLLVACGLRNKSAEQQVAWVAEQIEDELELNADQKLKLMVLQEKSLVALKEYRSQGRRQHAQMTAMLQQPSLDREQARQLLDERNRLIDQHTEPVLAAVADLYDSLNSEQREVLQEYLADFIERRERYWN